jgi:hypothetical protein
MKSYLIVASVQNQYSREVLLFAVKTTKKNSKLENALEINKSEKASLGKLKELNKTRISNIIT